MMAWSQWYGRRYRRLNEVTNSSSSPYARGCSSEELMEVACLPVDNGPRRDQAMGVALSIRVQQRAPAEDEALAASGLDAWADALEAEDRR
jgi:hypothetical protein